MKTDNKMHRCPHCGKRAFKNKQWVYTKYSYHSEKHDNGKQKRRILTCPHCGKYSRFSTPERKYWPLFTISLIATVALLKVSKIVLNKTNSIIVSLLVLLVVIINAIVAYYVDGFSKKLLPCDHDTKEFLYPRPDAMVTVDSSKYIKPYKVYGFKFKQGEADAKYMEAFPDGLVPAVFHPNKKGSLTYDIHIINRSVVPQDMLFDGAKFLVEDTDGIFIAKGTVESSRLDI